MNLDFHLAILNLYLKTSKTPYLYKKEMFGHLRTGNHLMMQNL